MWRAAGGCNVNITYYQSELRKGLSFVYHREHEEKKLNENCLRVSDKIVAKHGQVQGYKWVPRELHVPISTMHDVNRKCKSHGTADNMAPREKVPKDCSKGLSECRRKQLNQLLNIYEGAFPPHGTDSTWLFLVFGQANLEACLNLFGIFGHQITDWSERIMTREILQTPTICK